MTNANPTPASTPPTTCAQLEWSTVAREVFVDLYETQGMSLSEIGQLFGRSKDEVRTKLVTLNIPRRQRGHGRNWAAVLTPEFLTDAYHGRGLSLEDIAREVGCGLPTAARYFHGHGLELDPGRARRATAVNAERHLAVREQQSAQLDVEWAAGEVRAGRESVVSLAKRTGVPAPAVTQLLAEEGVVLRLGRRPLPSAIPLTFEYLLDAYTERALSVAVIAREAGTNGHRVRRALVFHEIELRPRPVRQAASDAA